MSRTELELHELQRRFNQVYKKGKYLSALYILSQFPDADTSWHAITRLYLLLKIEQDHLMSAQDPCEYATSISPEAIEDCADAQLLGFLAWTLSRRDSLSTSCLSTAHRLALRANELSTGESPILLATLARTHWLRDERQEAIDLQTKAVSQATSQKERTRFMDTLEEYERELDE